MVTNRIRFRKYAARPSRCHEPLHPHTPATDRGPYYGSSTADRRPNADVGRRRTTSSFGKPYGVSARDGPSRVAAVPRHRSCCVCVARPRSVYVCVCHRSHPAATNPLFRHIRTCTYPSACDRLSFLSLLVRRRPVFLTTHRPRAP